MPANTLSLQHTGDIRPYIPLTPGRLHATEKRSTSAHKAKACMKKFFLILTIALLAIGGTAQAQRSAHAFGAHFGGSTIDLEYQNHRSQQSFLDITAGVFDLDKGFCGQMTFNRYFRQWANWTPDFATWKFWGGLGGGLGFYDAKHGDDGFFFGPVAVLGFGFTLKDAPLTFGIDYRPMVAFNVGDDFSILDRGFRNLGVTLTYRF